MLCLTWLVIAVLCLGRLPSSAAIYLLPALFVGAVAGVMQARARARTAARLQSVKSMIGVRRVLLGSADGKAAIWLLLLMAIGMVAALWPLAGKDATYILLGGYAMFSFAREWFALPGTYRLQ
jgi:hypothetical protein